jgi:NADH dehydrogenase
LGVQVRTGVRVNRIGPDGVEYKDADGREVSIPARTVLWAGGVAVSEIVKELARATHAPVDQRGRIQVLPDLTVPGHPEIFVAGDIAGATRADGRPLPGVAQVALQQGRYVGKAIRRRLAGKPAPGPFSYFDRGDMAVIGRQSAVANLFGFEVSGWPAWFIWLFIHLAYLLEFQSRIIVLIRWAFQYLTFRRGARLITGRHAAGGAVTEKTTG